MTKRLSFALPAVLLILPGFLTPQAPETVRAIAPPATPLPAEAASAGVTRFAFIVYGDTRGPRDDREPQHDHGIVMDGILAAVERLKSTEYPVRFVLQSGDAVLEGRSARQWNEGYTPIVEKLTQGANIPYYLIPGNHDVTAGPTLDAPGRSDGVKNFLDAMSGLIPLEDSPRRLKGYPTYALGYGNTFVLGIDSNIAGDDKQFDWARAQLEGLDRNRYVNVFAFMHHPPFTSGPHSNLEVATIAVRERYMPLFRKHHVRAVLAGHDHLFDHYVERYTDASGSHRMDLMVSGGGGAPLYRYQKEPPIEDYERAGADMRVRIEHLVKPGPTIADNPHHFVIIRVDGENLSMEVIGVDSLVGDYHPHGKPVFDLKD